MPLGRSGYLVFIQAAKPEQRIVQFLGVDRIRPRFSTHASDCFGIEATEVLVQTRYTAEPSLLRSEKAAIPVFDHGIAYLPGKNGAPGIWLDATSPESRLGPHLGRDPACLRDPTLPEVRLRPSPVDQVHRQPRRPNGG